MSKGCDILVTDAGDLRLRGELSYQTVPQLLLDGEVALAAGVHVDVDLGEVSRSDSAGLALLVAWARQARLQGKRLNFINVPDQLQDIARLSGLDGILPIL